MKLKNPPIHEVVIQIDFANLSNDYTLELSALRQELLQDYPLVEPLGGSKLPMGILEAFSRHRFLSSDKKSLVHLGESVIAINTLSHVDFSTFRKIVKKILSIHKKIRQADKVKKIGLRYINKITKVSPGEALSFSLESPDLLLKEANNFVHLYIYKDGEDSLQLQVNKKEEDGFFYLDLDFFSQNIDSEYNIENILSWADKAHESISSSFEKCLNPNFLKSLK